MSTPVVAIKTLTVDAWLDYECPDCREDIRRGTRTRREWPRMSPLFVAPDEKPFAVMDDKGRFACPHCGKAKQDERAFASGNSSDLGKAKNKKVELTLLIHPQWLEGCPKHDEQGREYGGSATDSVEATIRWNNARAAKLRLLEVRGTLPEQVTCPETKVTFYTDETRRHRAEEIYVCMRRRRLAKRCSRSNQSHRKDRPDGAHTSSKAYSPQTRSGR